jgi:thiol-disulfide isomerase/thioredoxin
MDGPSTQPARPEVRRSISAPSVMGGLALAAALVLAAVIFSGFPDSESSGEFGIVAQVESPVDAVSDLETAPKVGGLAPNFRLQTLDGDEVLLSDLRGQPVFINFWATWCFFCISEMPAIQKLANEYGDDVVMLGVNVAEPRDDAQTFATNFEITYSLLLDRDRKVTEAYQVRSMPTSVFVDANGVIRSFGFGVMFPDQIREQIDPLVVRSTAFFPSSDARLLGREEQS